MGNIDKGLIAVHCTEMGADSLAENTPNAPEFICPICLLKSKRLHWVSVVRGFAHPQRGMCSGRRWVLTIC